MESETLKQLSLKVSQYFLEFLESDFKRQQAPRRRIILQSDGGFKTGMSLSPYQTLHSAMWKELGKPWPDATLTIGPGTHKKPLSPELQAILREQVLALTEESRARILSEVRQEAATNIASSISHPEDWISTVRTQFAESTSTHIVRPMLALLDTALKNQAYSPVDSVYMSEADLIEALIEPLDATLPDILAKYSVSRDFAELDAAADALFAIDYVRERLKLFFENFASADAYLEIRDLESFATTAENVQIYLYVGTVRYGSTSYPLFYLPLDVSRDEVTHSYTLKFSNQIYANKRAIDFILQELGQKAARQWLSPIQNRITYLPATSSVASTLAPFIGSIVKAFNFSEDLPIPSRTTNQLTSTNVSISNQLLICAFDKSDDGMLNDYEEMISQIHKDEPGVVRLFQSIISGVIESNPESISAAIEAIWDKTTIPERLVVDSPIPLNEEQQKVLRAIQHDTGRIVVVEGPPGTGKSHTIVAIAADCALNKKSCLILSDKREALEVVYDKLSKAMNDVRSTNDFPNPLLRLGTEQANFRKLTSSTSLSQVSSQVKATKQKSAALTQDRDLRRDQLRKCIQQTAATLGAISIRQFQDIELLRGELHIELGEVFLSSLEADLHRQGGKNEELSDTEADNLKPLLMNLLTEIPASSDTEFLRRVRELKLAQDCSETFIPEAGELCPALTEEQLQKLSHVMQKIEAERQPIFGWLFKRRKLQAFATECQSIATFSSNIRFPADLDRVQFVLGNARKLSALVAKSSDKGVSFDAVYKILSTSHFPIVGISKLLAFASAHLHSRARTDFSALLQSANPSKAADLWIMVMRYAQQFETICKTLEAAPDLQYVSSKSELERLNTVLMNSVIDSRLVDFMETSRTDAKVLSQLIKEKQKFPEEKFESVKNAFPVMIASIREFGEYMPLKGDLLDVLVIDEASQVSVAQAFPALLRAKKVVVMGDANQFSNTKSSNASNEQNQKHLGELEAFFRREVSSQADKLERLSYFDVKRSVLEFCHLCANYSIMLRKHFRSYKELINYSSTTFYAGQLQAIRLRTVPLSECIEFSEVVPSSAEQRRNVNRAEADFIIEKCVELLDGDSVPTVGVITPFREQQSLIIGLITAHPKYDSFRSQMKLKVMTFDSCQGEERQIVFYSMVATREADLLNYIFPVLLENVEENISEKLKMQRLNVGFSRAQEMVWFVLSKPIEEFKGSIGNALRHFDKMRRVKTASPEDTDPLSPMENRVLEWIYATEFYQRRTEQIEVTPQFPIGDYLKQLDGSYKHPAWKVDFLISVEVEGRTALIIVEYDGFEYHFKNRSNVNAYNFDRYLNDSDVERQLTLESYGYRFLRLNRFNLGADPVRRLSERLEDLLNKMLPSDELNTIREVNDLAKGLQDKSSKQCSRCNVIKPVKMFFDQSLAGGAGGHGRVCADCKRKDTTTGKPQEIRRRYRRRWR